MPTVVGSIVAQVVAFFTENAIVMLVFAAGGVLSGIMHGVKKLSKGAR
jgi:hypothetical protein